MELSSVEKFLHGYSRVVRVLGWFWLLVFGLGVTVDSAEKNPIGLILLFTLPILAGTIIYFIARRAAQSQKTERMTLTFRDYVSAIESGQQNGDRQINLNEFARRANVPVQDVRYFMHRNSAIVIDDQVESPAANLDLYFSS